MSAIIYRGWVKTRAIGTEHMLPPSLRVAVTRVSIGGTKAALDALLELMHQNIPQQGLRTQRAEAILEVSSRMGINQMVRYSGVPTSWRPPNVMRPCAVCAGQWQLEYRAAGVLAPLCLEVGQRWLDASPILCSSREGFGP